MDSNAANETEQDSVHPSAEMNTEECEYQSLHDEIRGTLLKSIPLPTASQTTLRTSFMPRDRLAAIITPNAVREELRRNAPHIPEMFRAMYAKAICNPSKPRRKIFAILVLIKQVSIISKFMDDNNMTDSILPVVLLDNSTRTRNGISTNNTAPSPCFSGLPSSVIRDFTTTQWVCLAPVFNSRSENLQVYNLGSASILPFIELGPEQRSPVVRGGFSSVSRVAIHPAHHDIRHTGATTEKNASFAVKQLHGLDGVAYKAELDALQKIHHLEHPHIVKALFSYTHRDQNYFVFPWADCNLRQYWNRYTDCSHRPGKEVVKWTLQQSVGLASGIESLHNKGPDYGRHGDLKPENILWFSDSNENGHMRGTLKISDFGLTRFHHKQERARHIVDRHRYGTAIYSPPEVQETRSVSQSMDVWSLGCIFLESFTWLTSGREGLQALSTSRASTSTRTIQSRFEDAYFEISYDGDQIRGSAQLKPGVVKFIDNLRTFPRFSSCFDDIFSFVQHRMLQPSPIKRVTASEVVSFLTSVLARYENTMLKEGGSVIDNVFHFEDENWDEYGVGDALQHNLLADGVGLLQTVATSSDPSSKSLSQPVWDAQDISRECSSASISPPRPSPSPEPLSILPDVNAWNNTFDSGYCSIPLDAPDQLGPVEPPTPSSGQKRRLHLPLAIPEAGIKRKKKIANSSSHQVSSNIPSNFPKHPSLFPCPFYHHDPAKYGTKQWHSCMGPGWNIPRLKEHIYRRHCLLEHVCQRCLSDFESQSELTDHQKEFLCPELLEPISGKICKLKKDHIRKRRAKMPDAEKWVAMYQILFDCEPIIALSLDKEISQPSQPTENPEKVTDFEHFVQNEKLLGYSDDSSKRAQMCLDMIQKWRESRHVIHPTQLSQDPFAVPHSDILDIANASAPQLPAYETELFPDAGNPSIVPKPPDFEISSGDRPFLDNLHNTCDVTDQWLSEAFSSDLTGDLQGSFNNSATGNMFIPGDWDSYVGLM